MVGEWSSVYILEIVVKLDYIMILFCRFCHFLGDVELSIQCYLKIALITELLSKIKFAFWHYARICLFTELAVADS